MMMKIMFAFFFFASGSSRQHNVPFFVFCLCVLLFEMFWKGTIGHCD